MNKNFRILLVISLFSFCCSNVRGNERFVIIGEASIPALTDSAQSISKFADQVAPGSSLLFAGGIIALVFQLHDICITSDLRIVLYADSTGKKSTPQIAFIAKPSGKVPNKIKFNKHKFPVKQIGESLFIAETNELLKSVSTLPPSPNSESALLVKLYPEKYFTDCAGTIEAFKAKLQKEFSKGRKEKNVKVKGEIKALEKILNQCREINLVLNATSENLSLDLSIFPQESTTIAKLLQSHQGTLTQDDIVKLTGDVAGSQDFIITDEIKSALSFLLSQIFSKSDTNAIADKVCKFNISSDKTKLDIRVGITPQQAKDILTITGVLKHLDKKNNK